MSVPGEHASTLRAQPGVVLLAALPLALRPPPGSPCAPDRVEPTGRARLLLAGAHTRLDPPAGVRPTHDLPGAARRIVVLAHDQSVRDLPVGDLPVDALRDRVHPAAVHSARAVPVPVPAAAAPADQTLARNRPDKATCPSTNSTVASAESRPR